MNKTIKGSVAGATGVALLLGGFGTYALWSDSEDYAGGSVASGVLDVKPVTGTAVWQEISGDVGANPQAWAPATDKMVPGDEVELTQPLDVEASGKNLKVKLTVGGITEDFSNMTITVDYAGKTVSSAADGSGALALDFGTADLAALNSATDAVVTFDFPSTVAGQVDQTKSANLSAVTVGVAQVRP